MKYKIPIAALAVLAASIAIDVNTYRPALGTSPWRGYRVLYVPLVISEETTLKLCAESGFETVITGTEPEMPFIAPFAMPITVPLSVTASLSLNTEYLVKRQLFFTDKDKNYRLYYLPDSAESKLRSLLARFQRSGITDAGIDISETYPWPIPVVVFLVLCVFTFFAKARPALVIGGVPMLLFSAILPQYPAGAAACLFLYGLFLLQKTWLRGGFVRHWASLAYGPFFLTAAAAICFVFSVKCGLLFLLNALGSASALVLLARFTKYTQQRKHPALWPAPIRPASLIPADTIAFTGIPAGGILLLGIFFAFQSFFFPISGKKDLYFPAPIRYTETSKFTPASFAELEALRADDEDELPDLGSFIVWVWNTLVFPYRSLNMNAPGDTKANPVPEAGTVVSIPVYAQTDSGIVESEQEVYVFDDAFIAEALNALDNEPVFEQVLKAQGQFLVVSYTAQVGGQEKQSPLSLILLIAALAVSPAAALTFVIKKKAYE